MIEGGQQIYRVAPFPLLYSGNHLKKTHHMYNQITELRATNLHGRLQTSDRYTANLFYLYQGENFTYEVMLNLLSIVQSLVAIVTLVMVTTS